MRKLTLGLTAVLLLIVLAANAAFAAPGASGAQSHLSSLAVGYCSSCGGSGGGSSLHWHGVHWGHGGSSWASRHGCCCGHCCPAEPKYPVVCAHDHRDLHRDHVSRQHAPWQQVIPWLN